jgi:hypothetical protein
MAWTAPAVQGKNLTLSETFGCSHVCGCFRVQGLSPVQPLWPLALM